jgi:hypothetical protein
MGVEYGDILQLILSQYIQEGILKGMQKILMIYKLGARPLVLLMML